MNTRAKEKGNGRSYREGSDKNESAKDVIDQNKPEEVLPHRSPKRN
jgi:hypothetical protein